MRITQTQLVVVAAVALFLLCITYWSTTRATLPRGGNRYVFFVVRRHIIPVGCSVLTFCLCWGVVTGSVPDESGSADDPVIAKHRKRARKLKEKLSGNGGDASSSYYTDDPDSTEQPGAAGVAAGGGSVLSHHAGEFQTAVRDPSAAAVPGGLIQRRPIRPAGGGGSSSPPPVELPRKSLADLIPIVPAVEAPVTPSPRGDSPKPLTLEEMASAKVLADYRELQAWKWSQLEKGSGGGWSEPKFCVNNPLCDDSRRDRAMYERRAKRFADPDYVRGFEKRDCPRDQPITIHLEHKIRSWWSHVTNPMIATLGECPVKCGISDSPASADILYSMVHPMPKHGGRHQKTAVVSLESFKGHEGQNIDESISQSSDIVVSYSKLADVWVNYWYGLTGDDWNNCAAPTPEIAVSQKKRPAGEPLGLDCLDPAFPPDLFLKRKLHPNGALSPLFVSNCHSGRGNYLQELMKHVTVDSYGGCFTTPGLSRAEQGRIPKQKLSREYKFHLAFENSILDDYVTGMAPSLCGIGPVLTPSCCCLLRDLKQRNYLMLGRMVQSRYIGVHQTPKPTLLHRIRSSTH